MHLPSDPESFCFLAKQSEDSMMTSKATWRKRSRSILEDGAAIQSGQTSNTMLCGYEMSNGAKLTNCSNMNSELTKFVFAGNLRHEW